LLQGHALAEADVVLDLAGVADGHAGLDEITLANDHVTPTPGAWMDASEVPEPARGRQSRGRVDISQLMNLKIPLDYGRAFQDDASVQCGLRSLAL
jgi:hypothetical protein